MSSAPLWSTSQETIDGNPPWARIKVPSHSERTYLVGTMALDLQTNISKSDISRVLWSVDGSRLSPGDPFRLVFAFKPRNYRIEACIITSQSSSCDLVLIGITEHEVVRNIATRVWVSDSNGDFVSGLTKRDFRLLYRGKVADPNRIELVDEYSLNSTKGVCIAFGFDISQSIARDIADDGSIAIPLMVNKDGSYEFSPEFVVRLTAVGDVMRGVFEPGISNPELDSVVVSLFAGSHVLVGPRSALDVETIEPELKQLLVSGYLKAVEDQLIGKWSATNLYGNVNALADTLEFSAECKGKNRAIVIDSDLINTATFELDINDRTLQEIWQDLREYDYEELSRLLLFMGVGDVPVYAIDRKVRPFTVREEGRRQRFLANVVSSSGGEVLYAGAGRAKAARKLKSIIAYILKRSNAYYDVFWNPEWVGDPEHVRITVRQKNYSVSYAHPKKTPKATRQQVKLILRDKMGFYNNLTRLTAAMRVRKAAEERRSLPVSRKLIRSVLAGQEEGENATGNDLVFMELELALYEIAMRDIKEGRNHDSILGAVRDLGKIRTVDAKKIQSALDYVPETYAIEICDKNEEELQEAIRDTLCSR